MISEILKYRRRKRYLEDAVNVTLGALVGVAAGVLFAPQSGEETRAQIAQQSKEAALKAKDVAEDLTDAVGEKYSEFQDYSKDLIEKVKKNAEEGVEFTKEQIDALEEAAGEIADEAKDKVKEAKRDVKETASNVKDTAEDVKDDLKQAKDDVKKDVKKKPNK